METKEVVRLQNKELFSKLGKSDLGLAPGMLDNHRHVAFKFWESDLGLALRITNGAARTSSAA